MATIDIGKIKPVFKGTYNNSTAYVLDDIVYYNGSSYVAKTSTTGNLPTDTTKWNVLASGSGGIWDGSLSIGSAGQVVKVNSGATALEFADAPSGKVKQLINMESGTNYSVNGGEVACTNYYMNITPESTSSKIIVSYSFNFKTSDDGNHSYHEGLGYPRIYRTIGGSSTMLLHDEFNYHVHYIAQGNTSQVNERVVTYTHVDSPNTTSQVTYELRLYSDHSNYYLRSRHATGYTMEIL